MNGKMQRTSITWLEETRSANQLFPHQLIIDQQYQLENPNWECLALQKIPQQFLPLMSPIKRQLRPNNQYPGWMTEPLFKYRFSEHSGMVRPTDQATTIIERWFVILRDPKTRGTAHHWGSYAEALGLVQRQRETEVEKQCLGEFLVVCTGRNKQGRVNRVRIGWIE